MIAIDELLQENRELTDLWSVLDVLSNSANLHGNPVYCEMMDNFIGQVNAHLLHEDRTVYSDLLMHAGERGRLVADQFMQNTHELKRICTQFDRDWCQTQATTGDPEGFQSECRDFLRLVKQRIEMENQRLFPMLKQVA